MKKLSYLLGLLIAGSLIFSACNKDEEEEAPKDLTPTIAFETGGEDVTAVVGDTLKFSVVCASNSISGEKLDKFRIYMMIENVEYPTPIDETGIDETVYSAGFDYPLDYAFTGRLYAEITDVDGQTSNVSFNVTVEEATTPLEGEEDLEWVRAPSTNGTNLDMFGLKWTYNEKTVYAVIEPDSAQKFVQLDSLQWVSITTKEDLALAVEDADSIVDYRNVSAFADGTYNDVLATKFNDEYFILNIQEGIVVFDSIAGTTVTINGKYNK